MGGVRDVITCAKFQIEIFMGYDFTAGRIFDFPIDFSMGLTTVQRYCAACDTCHPVVLTLLETLECAPLCVDEMQAECDCRPVVLMLLET